MPYRGPHPSSAGVCLGVFATLLQVSVARELLGLWGGSELVVAVMLVAWLLGLSLSALGAAQVSAQRGFVVAGALAGPVSVCLLLALRLCPTLWELPPGGEPSVGQLLGLVGWGAGTAGALVGFLFTTAAVGLSRGAAGATQVYAAEAGGAVAAGVGFAWIFAGFVPHLVVTAVSAAPLLGLALQGWPRLGRRSPAILAFFAAVGLCAAAWQLESWSTARAFASIPAAGQLIAAAETAYSRVTVGQSQGQRQLYLDGRLSDTFPEPYDKPWDVHLALVQHPRPKSLLVLGALPADRVEAALAHGLSRVVFVILDQRLVRLLTPWWPPSTQRALGDPRVSVVADDGRSYLRQCRERFDVVLLQGGTPRTLSAARNHTVEAFASAKSALNPGGSLSTSTGGAASQLSNAAAAAAGAELLGLRQVFRYLAVSPGLSLSYHASDSSGVVTGDSSVLAQRLAQRRAAQTVDLGRLEDAYDRRRAEGFLAQIAAHPVSAAEDLRPTAHLWAIAGWAEVWHSVSLASFRRWSAAAAAMGVVLAMLIVGLASRRSWTPHRGRGVLLFGVAATGMAGMSLQIAALLVYQIGSGALYRGLALLLGLFMAGLALGSWFGHGRWRGNPRRGLLISELLMLVVAGASAGVLVLGTEEPTVVLLWSPVVGAATGLAFPIYLGLCRGEAGAPEPVGPVTAADHAGAAVGALLTSLVLLPGLGLPGAALALAGIKLLTTILVRRATAHNV